MGIWFRAGFNFSIVTQSRDPDGRLLSLLVKLDGNIYIKLINIYAPIIPKYRKIFFTNMLHYFMGQHSIILGGDFNCVVNNTLDKRGGNDNYGEFGGGNLQTICNDFNLVDSFRHKYKNKKEYTWRNSMNTIEVRLDRLYLSKNMCNDSIRVHHIKVPHIFSDHDSINVKIKLSQNKNKESGPGFWKCNVSTLKDEHFQDDFQALWESLDSESNQDSHWWEHCKCCFKDLITVHSQRLTRIRKENQKHARKRLDKLLTSNRNNSVIDQNRIAALKQDIETLYNEEMEGCKIRAKVKYLETSEKPTRLFLRREKQLASKKSISHLIKSDGTSARTTSEITEECVQFYKTLYSKEAADSSLNLSFFNELARLSEESANICEGPITIEECVIALKQMANSKTPGLDGLPKEFYEFAFKYIGNSFVRLINRCYSEGILPPSQRQGLITLICKDPDNAETLKNWRPISLLNVDYKIISKVLTLRLRKVIGDIVHPDQTCSIPGRSIQDNIHLIRNLIEYANSKQISAAIISLDQAKAFDRVSHSYLFDVLHAFGFKPQFIAMVKLLYTDIKSKIIVNGFISSEFAVERSVRQGCSLSPSFM